MLLATLIFGSRRQHTTAELEDAAGSYLGSLLQAGQIYGHYFLTWIKGRLHAHVLLGGKDALLPRFHSPAGKRDLKQLIRVFGAPPQCLITDDDANQPEVSWRKAPWLYLFTTALDISLPVCNGAGGPSIPVHLLPVTFFLKEELYRWQNTYACHDSLWLKSGALEIPAYRQLADPGSELSEEGRAICQVIEQATKRPTYYFLMRYWGRKQGEQNRLCPGCGSAWSVEYPQTTAQAFRNFAFKCEPCRLVSHLCVDTNGGRYAKIGEFTPKQHIKNP